MPTANPFPLTIGNKEDAWEKLQLVANVDPNYKYTAQEWNIIIQALTYLYENIIGSVPSTTPAYKAIYINITTPEGEASTISQIEDSINTAGFQILAGSLYKFKLKLSKTTATGLSLVEETYVFKKNNIEGTWGTGSTNGVVYLSDFIYEDLLVLIPNVTEDTQVIELGDIGSETIQFHINNLDPATIDWEVLSNDGTSYNFYCIINGLTHIYEIKSSSLPITVGAGNTPVSGSDFDLVAISGGIVSTGGSGPTTITIASLPFTLTKNKTIPNNGAGLEVGDVIEGFETSGSYIQAKYLGGDATDFFNAAVYAIFGGI